jgi:chromosome segregation ATPase
MQGKDPLLHLEDQNALLQHHVAAKEHEIAGLREQLRQRELALEAFVSPLKQTPLPERGGAAGSSGRVQELSSRIHALETEQRALKRENKALQEVDVRKGKALDELDRAIKSLEEERDVQKLAHAQEMAELKARAGEAHALIRQHDDLERVHAALAEECAALRVADSLRVKDWMAEGRRLKEEVRARGWRGITDSTLPYINAGPCTLAPTVGNQADLGRYIHGDSLENECTARDV